jgi:hypothetical protein
MTNICVSFANTQTAQLTHRLVTWFQYPQFCLAKHHTYPLARTQNSPFPSEINTVRFCYQDKFVLLSSRNRLSLFKYFIDPSKDQDLKRYALLFLHFGHTTSCPLNFNRPLFFTHNLSPYLKHTFPTHFLHHKTASRPICKCPSPSVYPSVCVWLCAICVQHSKSVQIQTRVCARTARGAEHHHVRHDQCVRLMCVAWVISLFIDFL